MIKGSEKHSLPLLGELQFFTLIRRKRQKYINLRVSFDGQLLVSAPVSASLKRIKAAVMNKQNWVKKHVRAMNQRYSDLYPLRALLFRGDTIKVTVNNDTKRKARVHHNEEVGTIVIHSREADPEVYHSALKRWLTEKARLELPGAVAAWAMRMDIDFNKLFIRNQKSRWGSSSDRGNISLNWRAIMVPKEVLEYLIVHELAHQIHMDHSKTFWALVEHWSPDFRKWNAWLRKHAYLLAILR